MGIIRKHLIISGRVQGVSFRMNARQQALAFSLTGWVRNLPDGQVEIVAEGDESQLAPFVDWCHQGPRFASVEAVKISSSDSTGEYQSFIIL